MDPAPGVRARVGIAPGCSTGNEEDVLTLPASVWDVLYPSEDSTEHRRAIVSLEPGWTWPAAAAGSSLANSRKKGKRRVNEALSSQKVLVWAQRGADSPSASSSSGATPTVLLPPRIHRLLPSSSQQELLIAPLPSTDTLPTLTQVVLLAQSAKVWNRVGKGKRWRELLFSSSPVSEESERIIREGGIWLLPSSEQEDEGFKVVLAEPVLQGFVHPEATEIILLPPREGLLDDASDDGASSSAASDAGLDAAVDGGSDEDDDLVEIDEDFLANALLDGVAPSPFDERSPLAEEDGTTTPRPRRSHKPKQNAHSVALARPVPGSYLAAAAPARRLGGTEHDAAEEDEEPRVYFRAREVGRLGGVFDGDWVVVTPLATAKDAEGEGRRLVRAFVLPDSVLDSLEISNQRDGQEGVRAYMSPTLAHNLRSYKLSILPSPFLLPNLAASSFPTASSVSVARVASPQSVNRAFQPLFLEGLKSYFEGSSASTSKNGGMKRVLKVGDLVGVPIAEDSLRFGAPGGADGDEVQEEPLRPYGSEGEGKNTSVVFFKITSLGLGQHASSLAKDEAEEEDLLLFTSKSVERSLKAGRLGALVDPRKTKMIQTGVERSYVPDLREYALLSGEGNAPSSLGAVADEGPWERLKEYVEATRSKGAQEYGLALTVLVSGAKGSGKKTFVRGLARGQGLHVLELDCFELLGDTDLKTEAHLRARVEKAASCSPCILLLRNIEALARKSQALETGQDPPMSSILRECFASTQAAWKATGFPVLVFATTSDVEKVPTSVVGLFKEQVVLEAPSERQRLAILEVLVREDILAKDVSLKALAIQTAALVASDLVDLVGRARTASVARVLAASDAVDAETLRLAGIAMTGQDFSKALEKARASYSESIGAPKIPSVTWDDVGGLASVKKDILDTIQLPLEHPELFAEGLKKRSGILLYGPPGTGKTLLAKAVATSCSLNFFSVKGPELLNMYIGESEANVRRVFQRARDAKPCVIFFDELDSVAPKRGNQGDSGGVMDRIVSQLLAELDGMAEGKGGSDVFVIGATNRPDLLDPALLRPGRFDRMLYLGVSDTHDSQLRILEALTRKFKLDPDLRLIDIAAKCPFHYSGADFYALCSDAMLKAMTRKAGEVDVKIVALNDSPPYSTGDKAKLTPQYYLSELAAPDELEVRVSQVDFERALAELVPSISQNEIEHYQLVRQKFSAETLNKAAAAEEEPVPTVNGMNGGEYKVGSQVALKLPNGDAVNPAELVNGSSIVVADDDSDMPPPQQSRKGKGKAAVQD